MKSSKPYFAFIRDATAAIEKYAPENREAFLADQRTQNAILMRLQQIGENLIRIRALNEERFRSEAPETWHMLIGLRNIISHGYQAIDWIRIWTLISEGIPEFKSSIDQLGDEFNSIIESN